MDKNKVKENAKEIKQKADEIIKETGDKTKKTSTESKPKKGKLFGDPMVELYE